MSHRGFDLHGAENTLKAFQAAVDLGSEYLETDVHATADGVVLAFHDDTLDRVSTGSGRVSEHRYDELAAVRVGGEPLCRLSDLLQAFPTARFNIDVKSKDVIEPLVEVLQEGERSSPGLLDRICIASFSESRRRGVLRRLPGRVTSSAGTTVAGLFWLGSRHPLLAPLAAVAARGVDALQVPEHHHGVRVVDARLVAAAHRYGLVVHVWTINDDAAMVRLLQLGVDGLVTDRTDVALPIVAHHREQNPPT